MNPTSLKLELKRILRSPQFFLFTIGMPVVFFLFFAGLYGTQDVGGVKSSTLTMLQMAAYGAMAAALFTGTRIATERTEGWQRQLRITPLRGPGYLLVKVSTSMLVALPVLLAIFVAGLAQGVELTAAQWITALGALWLGCLPFAALGIMIGLFGKGDTVQAITGGLMAPLSMLSGLFIPLRLMPDWMAVVAKILPSYWLLQFGQSAVLAGPAVGLIVAVLAAWVLVPGFVVVKRFRLGTARV
ncbi:ABC transporter permease [Amycolatopsis sp. H20-H5]|uniref:ABC transporter permease n=1 Tax=Amycolatopsis sp. H20-H5 TaxID=3046309 RepID=UPI002DBA1E24|nr:ABC transporter permease [Amycolatopsis sp. H20-H5]MEC3981309.1 ABC transporter permease [Amycolatopsis sp. H20-H5]